MIKLFGWERRIATQLAEKRKEELVWYRKECMANVALGIVRCVESN